MMMIIRRFGRVATLALSFFISLLIVRLYGSDVMGVYTYTTTLISIFVLIVSFGTNQTILSSFEKNNVDTAASINIKLYLFNFTILVTFISLFIVNDYIFQNKSLLYIIIVLTIVLISSLSNVFKYISIRKEKIEQFYFIDIGIYLSLIINFIIFNFIEIDIIIIMGLSYLLFFIIFYYFYKNKIKIKEILFNTKIEISYLKNSFYSFITTLFLMLSYKFNIFFIKIYYSEEELGLYVVSMIIIDVIIMFLASFMLADITKLKQSSSIYIYTYIGKYLIVSFLLLIFIKQYGYEILTIVYNLNDIKIEHYLHIMMYIIPITLILKVVQNYFIINNKIKIYLWNGAIFFLALIVFNYINKGDINVVLYNYIYALTISTISSIIMFLYIKRELI